MEIVPITKVILKNGRTGTVRLSRTTIKHCKRENVGVLFFPENENGKEEIYAKDIRSILSEI